LKVKCRNVLVNFGGSDPTKETVKVLDMIESTGSLFAEIQFTIVSGAANENQAYIESRCKALSNVNYINYAHNMAELLNSSDIAIGAGGISMLERAYIGIPSLVICIAKNQEQPIFEGERQGILVNLGHSSNVSADHIAVELKKLASSYEARDKMRSACFQIMGQAFESDIKRIVFKTINACEKRELRRMD
jgi:UDP-2,4-diacetamido-2,4,6-trideoxy-beta-L-altropyranose hydrolase